MNHIYIEHNPFINETKFLINNGEPADGCKLSSYKEARLQLWVESLFTELLRLLNGDSQMQIEFRGVESDFLDIQDAAAIANAQGMEIELKWLAARGTEDRLSEINALMAEAMDNPQFRAFIHNNEQANSEFEEAFNNDFNVYVVATMSSGKSTLINAMLGKDLLPAANEATTATIAEIIDDKTTGESFSGRRFSVTGEQESHPDISLEMLREWNKMPETREIELRGNIVSMQPREHVRLVLTDTPGPNNSQDADHAATTMNFIKDSRRSPLILYVLNGTQLGTNDDKGLLTMIADIMRKGGKQSKDRFIFVVNKMDEFDPENGENIAAVLERVTRYLESNGISNPQIFPVSANLTRLLRKNKNPADLTRKERGELLAMTDLFAEEPSMDLPAYMPLTSRVKRALEVRGYDKVLKRSGLPAVEVMIDEYIDKYNFPTRVNRAYSALERAISQGMHENELLESLDRDEQQLALISEEIEALQERRKQGMNTEVYKERVRSEGKNLPGVIMSRVATKQADALCIISEVSNNIISQGTVDEATANIILNNAEKSIKFTCDDLTTEFDTILLDAQDIIKSELRDEYQNYIQAIFSEVRALSLPTLKDAAGDIALNFNIQLKEKDITEREERYNYRRVSTSKWYNPFSWGDTRTDYDTRTIKEVDLPQIWKTRRSEVEVMFNDYVEVKKQQLQKEKSTLINIYIDFIENEFNDKFDKLIFELQVQINDKDLLCAKIADAKEQQQWINKFKSRLNNTLALA